MMSADNRNPYHGHRRKTKVIVTRRLKRVQEESLLCEMLLLIYELSDRTQQPVGGGGPVESALAPGPTDLGTCRQQSTGLIQLPQGFETYKSP